MTARPKRQLARQAAAAIGLGIRAAPAGLAAIAVLEIVGASLGLASSYMIKHLVQAAVAHDAGGAAGAAGALALLGGGAWLLYLGYGRLAPRVVEAMSLRLDRELLDLACSLPTLDHLDRRDYVDRLSQVLGARQDLAGSITALVLNLRCLVLLGGALAILVRIEPLFVALPLFAVPRLLTARHAQDVMRTYQARSAQVGRLRTHIFGRAASAAAGAEIRILGLQGPLLARFRELTDQLRGGRARANWTGVGWLCLGDLTFAVGCVGAIAFTVQRALHGDVTLGDVVLVTTLGMATTTMISGAVRAAQYLQRTLLTMEHYLWLAAFAQTHAEPAPRLPRGGAPAPIQGLAEIRLEGVAFTYPGAAEPALSDVWLTLRAGRIVAIVGENGSGKSTLAKLLCGLYRPTSGRILIDGKDLEDIGLAAWRRHVTAMFQDFTNFEFRLHESVGIGELERIGDRVAAEGALDRAGAGTLAQLPPAGLDTLLGTTWRGVELSGGQWQKVSLARGLRREGPLLSVFDEPASFIDAAAEQEIFTRFEREARRQVGATRLMLVISHRLSTVRSADDIVVLHKGRLAACGSHDELMARASVYAELYDLQARSYGVPAAAS